MSNEYWCACVVCDEAFFGGKYAVLCPSCKAAQAIEAAKLARRETGSTEGESAVVADDAPIIGMGKSDQEGA